MVYMDIVQDISYVIYVYQMGYNDKGYINMVWDTRSEVNHIPYGKPMTLSWLYLTEYLIKASMSLLFGKVQSERVFRLTDTHHFENTC